jgi:hypothetical protein
MDRKSEGEGEGERGEGSAGHFTSVRYNQKTKPHLMGHPGVSLEPVIPYHSTPYEQATLGQPNRRPQGEYSFLFQRPPVLPMKHGPVLNTTRK